LAIAYNRTILAGNLTRDPEIRYTQGGTAVCDLGLAINDKRKDSSGQWVDDVLFADVTVWGRTAEIAEKYLHKGDSALIEGKLKLDQWTDSQSGQKRSKLKVVGERLVLLGSKQGGGGGSRQSDYSEPERQRSNDVPPPMQGDDDIPF
jgi:single-strand DNA-binding protein